MLLEVFNSASIMLQDSLNDALEAAYIVFKGGQYCF
jgi:hypothetical protein